MRTALDCPDPDDRERAVPDTANTAWPVNTTSGANVRWVWSDTQGHRWWTHLDTQDRR